MLQRDKYKPDKIQQYFPNYSVQKYYEYVSGAKQFYRLYFDQHQAQRWANAFSTNNNIVVLVFTVSLLPIIFHKKLPVLKRFNSKKSRFFWGLGFVFIPSNITGALMGRSTQRQILNSYNINLPDFKKYRQNKDLQKVNPTTIFTQY